MIPIRFEPQLRSGGFVRLQGSLIDDRKLIRLATGEATCHRIIISTVSKDSRLAECGGRRIWRADASEARARAVTLSPRSIQFRYEVP